MFSTLKPCILNAVPEQIKAKQKWAQTGQDFSLFLQSREKVGFQKRNHTFITYMQRMRGVRKKGCLGPYPSSDPRPQTAQV